MASATQAPRAGKRKDRLTGFAPALAVLLCALSAAGCSLGAMKQADAGVDSTLVTSNVPVPEPPADPERRSDEMTVRNAVSSADIAAPAAAPLAWANADTGSRGSISDVVESRESGTVCRKFRTTRESFDGVAIFDGKTCMVAPGAWQLTSFAPL